uniref:Uncharacterized protein n=1 Tax=Athene cunicularia TaxID=194338 RepID=A0A663N8U6_ATHCN
MRVSVRGGPCSGVSPWVGVSGWATVCVRVCVRVCGHAHTCSCVWVGAGVHGHPCAWWVSVCASGCVCVCVSMCMGRPVHACSHMCGCLCAWVLLCMGTHTCDGRPCVVAVHAAVCIRVHACGWLCAQAPVCVVSFCQCGCPCVWVLLWVGDPCTCEHPYFRVPLSRREAGGVWGGPGLRMSHPRPWGWGINHPSFPGDLCPTGCSRRGGGDTHPVGCGVCHPPQVLLGGGARGWRLNTSSWLFLGVRDDTLGPGRGKKRPRVPPGPGHFDPDVPRMGGQAGTLNLTATGDPPACWEGTGGCTGPATTGAQSRGRPGGHMVGPVAPRLALSPVSP